MNNRILALVIVLVLVAAMVAPMALAGKGGKPGKGVTACKDKIDNDGDSLVDLADPGCENRKDTDENNCGNSVCDGTEDCSSCEQDCGPCEYCGDGTCNGDETCSTCEEDCGVCDSCSDSDGGIDIVIQGTVSGLWNSNPYSYADACNGTILLEYYCIGTEPNTLVWECAGNYTGCANGACY
jgi:hypothetical protein